LLDEPLASLDLNYQHHVMRLLGRLADEHDMLVVIVVHDLNMALRYADLALLLYQGRLLASGPPHCVISPAHLSTAFKVHTRLQKDDADNCSVFVEGPIEL